MCHGPDSGDQRARHPSPHGPLAAHLEGERAGAHHQCGIGPAANYDATDLQFQRRPYDGFKTYAQSKQALRMLTWELAARLAGSRVTVNAVAPGFVRTDFNRNVLGFTATMINIFSRLMAVTPSVGADGPLWAAVAPELQTATGKYFDARKEKDGKLRNPEPIATLELCEPMTLAPCS